MTFRTSFLSIKYMLLSFSITDITTLSQISICLFSKLSPTPTTVKLSCCNCSQNVLAICRNIILGSCFSAIPVFNRFTLLALYFTICIFYKIFNCYFQFVSNFNFKWLLIESSILQFSSICVSILLPVRIIYLFHNEKRTLNQQSLVIKMLYI